MAEYKPITANELILAVDKACGELFEDGITPHEIVLDIKFESIAKAGMIHANDPSYKMTLFGLDVRFDNLPDGVEFIVS